MPTIPLPEDPSLEQLRKQAKELRDQAAAGAPAATELVVEFHPRSPHTLSLSGAQLVVARRYGFTSWDRLKQHLEVVQRYRCAPDQVPSTGNVVDEFLRLACLRYGDDTPTNWQEARRLLGEHPSIPQTSLHAAAAAADVAAVRRLLADDPGLADLQAGPYRWEPIMYLAYARHDPDVSQQAVLDTARLLLDHGADPNAGYLWHGLPSPFTVLTGLFGHGELGPGRQPPHPHALAMASLLLDAGADPNDSQTVYNRQFDDEDGPFALLLAHGLGRGDGGPWRARLADAVDPPRELVRGLLWWAVVHGQRARVQLLIDHDVEFDAPFPARRSRPFAGRRPVEAAALSGHPAIVNDLLARGAPAPQLEGPDALVAALFANDHDLVDRLRDHAGAARAARPALMVWAAANGNRAALRLLAELDFDVNALGRSDVPLDEPWETALHVASWNDDVELAELLLSLGADPNLHDRRFHATPLGWARHFGRQRVIELLDPVTSEDQ